MTTQVIFNIDKKLKDLAMKKAQSEGIAFSAVLKLATKAFIEGDLSVGLIPKEEFNANARREVLKAVADIKARKNLSPKFNSAKKAMVYLNGSNIS